VSLAEEVPAQPALEPQPAPAASSPDGLITPAVLVDRRQLQRNIDQMAERVRRAGAQLWPHVKTHKSPQITELQLRAGASGLTAATLTEAEMLADHGVGDILLAFPPVASWRHERVAALAGRCRLVVASDSVETILELDHACGEAGVTLRYLWELDCGLHRCGTEPGAPTVELVAALTPRTRAATFAGLMTFPGHAYGAGSDAELDAIAERELEAIRVTADGLRERGIACPLLSIGSTPTIHHLPGGVEGMLARPGNYVFYDATQVALGLVDQSDCALTVLATVISRVADDRFVLDSGSKALSSDRMSERSPGYGIVVDRPQLTIARLFEEHAIVHGPSADLAVGDRLRIIPNHSCAVANLHPELHILQDGRLVDRWPVGARGWARRARS
jgi:D-serine deaminase-like pyridoxal phosphate-dependent protein